MLITVIAGVVAVVAFVALLTYGRAMKNKASKALAFEERKEGQRLVKTSTELDEEERAVEAWRHRGVEMR